MSSVEKLLLNPLCRKEDLGKPLADSVHAVSVAMPLWEHVVAYEEGDEQVVKSLQTGYPRFLIHPLVQRLFLKVQSDLGKSDPCFVFPSLNVALRAKAYVEKEFPESELEIEELGDSFTALFFPEKCSARVKAYWQHSGEIISSRAAENLLKGRDHSKQAQILSKLKTRVAELSASSVKDVYLYPSGMAAIFQAHRLISPEQGGVGKVVQFGFPYVDTLKIVENFSSSPYFFKRGDEQDIVDLKKLLAEEKVSAVFCEFPSNPLLHSVDIVSLSKLLREAGVPLIVDETIGSFYNVELFPYADILVSSLTKFFSGKGNCIGGSLILNDRSPFYQKFSRSLESQYEDLNWYEDLACLLENSDDYESRIRGINSNAEALAEFLKSSPQIENVYYPKYVSTDFYQQSKKKLGGYSGLLSIVFKEGEQHARKFYDALRVCKGPNLGTDYTLVCPYVLLAHYHELAWAESCGIPSHLIRISVGLEPIDDLIERFSEALGCL